MKKLLFIFIIILFSNKLYSETPNKKSEVLRSSIIEYYNNLNFINNEVLDLSVFVKAIEEFLPLKMEKRIVTIINFDLSIDKKRLWVIDLKKRSVVYNTYVAHGSNSGRELPMDFSNVKESHKSSCGRFITGETYNSKKVGYALRIDGIDSLGCYPNYNVRERGIVFHASSTNTKLVSRSWGCPSLPRDVYKDIIDYIKENTFVYIYTSNLN